MATVGQIIFRIMIGIIVVLVAVIALIIGLSIAGNSTTNDVTTANAVGQIGEDVILSCTFTPDAKQSSNVLWQKSGSSGVVYKYENGKVSLTNQNSDFKDRTSLFLNQLSAGNASLKIGNVQMKDKGDYTCSITNSKGTGQSKLTLQVGAFTPLTVTNISQTTLQCHSPTWYPPPTVSWKNTSSGSNLTNSSTTTYVPVLSSMVEVFSDLHGAEQGQQYTCVMDNGLARATGNAMLTALGLKTQTSLEVLNSARSASASRLVLGLFLLYHLGGVDP